MRRTFTRSALSVFAALAALLPAAPARAASPRWEIVPEGGYLFGGSLNSDRDTAGKSILGGLDNAGVYGLRAAYFPGPNLEFEIEAARTDARYTLSHAGAERTTAFRTDYLIGSGGWRMSVGDTAESIARVSVGAGAARLEAASQPALTRFTGAVGAGFERRVFGNLGFRLDGRLYASRIGNAELGTGCVVPTNEDAGLPVARPCRQKGWLLNSDVTAGISIVF